MIRGMRFTKKIFMKRFRVRYDMIENFVSEGGVFLTLCNSNTRLRYPSMNTVENHVQYMAVTVV